MPVNPVKQSYTVTCSRTFRDSVLELAKNKDVNAADLARSVAIMVPRAVIDSFPDPGEPDATDRETVILKSGKSKGRPWQRKPRLQIRMAAGYDVVYLRKALRVALELDKGTVHLHMEAPAHGLNPEAIYKKADEEQAEEMAQSLRNVVAALAFQPYPHGINSRIEALHIMGFPPGSNPAPAALRARFRTLASVLHPDSGYGSHAHMSQLNASMDLLRDV